MPCNINKQHERVADNIIINLLDIGTCILQELDSEQLNAQNKCFNLLPMNKEIRHECVTTFHLKFTGQPCDLH